MNSRAVLGGCGLSRVQEWPGASYEKAPRSRRGHRVGALFVLVGLTGSPRAEARRSMTWFGRAEDRITPAFVSTREEGDSPALSNGSLRARWTGCYSKTDARTTATHQALTGSASRSCHPYTPLAAVHKSAAGTTLKFSQMQQFRQLSGVLQTSRAGGRRSGMQNPSPAPREE